MRIKKDDTVIVLTGKDKGKTGKVLKAMPKDGKVIVEGVNIQTKPKAPTRIGYKVENGKKVRVSKKTGAVID